MNKKGVSSILIAALLVVALIVCSLAAYWFYLDITEKRTPEVEEPYYGTLTLTISQLNVFDRTNVSTTSPSYEVFHAKGKSLDDTSKSDFTGPTSISASTATDFSINPEDNGYFFLRTYAGSAHFVDIDATYDTNDRVTAQKLVDVNNDNKLDVVYSIYVGDMGEPGQAQKVPFDFNVMVVTDDGTNVAMSSPSDKKLGNGTQTGAIEWSLTTFAEKKGFAIARIYVKQNRTEEDLLHVTEVSVSYAPSSIDITDPAPLYEIGATRWSVDLGVSDYREWVYCVLVKRDTGKASTLDITVSLESYFASGTNSNVTVTMYAELIKATNGFYSTLSDVIQVENFG